MKTRIQIIHSYATGHDAMIAMGYLLNKGLYEKDGKRFKLSWIHRNSWNQITHIDLLEI